ncbi:hypothetical protein N7494_010388 [Penicillium frequentans]|uniref:ADP-ribose 1''-phosphate phosphatase n=1 Tax=Penicillium frequentans TaxID=3151616 RepID=A0AAD6CHN7_9EURO|nr:hypothetical protein N7494_010388 [Penicillium glabrum]
MAYHDISPENIDSVTEKPGDIFDAPPRSALIHACNARGSWGAGIARDFARNYPWAYTKYREYCLKWKGENKFHDILNLHATGDQAKTISVRFPVGTALIIYPETWFSEPGMRPWVICLFTSADYGNRVDSPDMILNNTNAALHDLRQRLDLGRKQQSESANIDQLYACRFNSGLFGIPWAKTKELVDRVSLGLPLTIVYPPEEAAEETKAAKKCIAVF